MLETFQPEKVKIDSGKGGDDVTGRVDGLLWYTVLEDHSRLDSGPLSSLDSGPQGTFVGIYDGHGGPQVSFYWISVLFMDDIFCFNLT